MQVKCPKCGDVFDSPGEKYGKKDVCEKCNNVFVIDESVICRNTADSKKETPPKSAERDPIESANLKTRKKHDRVLPMVLGVIFIVIIVIVVLGVINRQMKRRGMSGITPPDTTVLVTGTYKIGAGSYMHWQFTCPDDGYRILGTVTVPEHDINIWLIKSPRELESFQRSETFYHLSEVSAERTSFHKIDCLLTAGSYYFVIDNRYSILTAKNPTVLLSLIY